MSATDSAGSLESSGSVTSSTVRCAGCGDDLVWDSGNGGQWLGATPPRDFMYCGGVADGTPHVSEREEAARAAGYQAGVDHMAAIADVLERKWEHDQAGYSPNKLGASVVKACRIDLVAAFSQANRAVSILDLPPTWKRLRRGTKLREDITPQAVVALRLAAKDMPLSQDGGPWVAPANWLARRADAFEEALGKREQGADLVEDDDSVVEGVVETDSGAFMCHSGDDPDNAGYQQVEFGLRLPDGEVLRRGMSEPLTQRVNGHPVTVVSRVHLVGRWARVRPREAG